MEEHNNEGVDVLVLQLDKTDISQHAHASRYLMKSNIFLYIPNEIQMPNTSITSLEEEKVLGESLDLI